VKSAPKVDEQLSRLMDLVVKKFITSWYCGINKSKNNTATSFESLVHSSSMHTLVTIVNMFEKQLDISNLCIRVFQETITHLKDYREFESLALPLSSYITENPSSNFSNIYTEEQAVKHLHDLSMKLLKRALPKQDRSSSMVVALLTEIMGSSVLLSVVNLISDPDYINQKIVAMSIDSENSLEEPPAKLIFPPVLPLISTKASTAKESSSSSQFYIKIVEARRLPAASINGKLYAHVICGIISI
jgi:hypothetical protein